MGHDFDYALAFALANNSLCIFAGAGLSKHLTANAMPDWRDLLELACDALDGAATVKSQLAQASPTFPLEDCAQILELAFMRESKDFRKTIADILSSKQPDPTTSARLKKFLDDHPGVDIVTTNYDTLIETMLPAGCNSNYPGKPVSRRDGAVDVFHIHGCVLNPGGMVVTTNDYYSFINTGGYFSQKVSTIFHENSTLILGYSLSDPNLKAILNAYRTSETRSINRGNLFYVTRSVIPGYIKDYYETAYGITVIENTEIDALLDKIEADFVGAQHRVAQAEKDMRSVLAKKAKWTNEYVKLRASLFHIIATANTLGIDIHSPPFTTMLGDLLKKKIEFTRDNGAWDQYAHLAAWLLYLGSIIDVAKTPLETPYLEAVTHSMGTMAKNYGWGYSWEAFKIWKTKWDNLTFQNRLAIRRHIQTSTTARSDALEVVMQ